jgi:uncharacterized alkaline shock family protein YloU
VIINQQQESVILLTEQHNTAFGLTNAEVFALVGSSGTGKSHRAIKLAHECGAEIIIDDGLIIKANQIIMGHTAKRQPTRIGAIKAALFLDKSQAAKAREVIVELAPEKILILGTSRGMVDKIAEALGLPAVTKYIMIEDIASGKEIERARMMRSKYAKHVIPAPTVEVRKSFPGTLIDPLKVFLKSQNKTGRKSWLEQSVVRPNFTYYGKLTISRHALIAIAGRAAEEKRGVKSAGKINLTQSEDGLLVDLFPVFFFGTNLADIAADIQIAVKKQLEYMTGLSVTSVNVTVKDIVIEGDKG